MTEPVGKKRGVLARVGAWVLGLFAAVTAAATIPSCGSAGGKGAGDQCSASSECASGLLCDLGKNPPVCADLLTIRPDAARIDAAPGDGGPGDDANPPDSAVPDARLPDSSIGDGGTD